IALGGSGTLLLAFAILALPPWVAAGSDGVLGRVLLLARWPALALLFATALGVLLRLAPSPSPGTHRTGWMSWGAVVGTVLWVAASYGLTLYVENVGAFGRLYGSLGSVVVVMMWFYLGAMAALVGAEIEGMRERESEGRGEDALKSALRRREKG
ncbi:MAG: YihY/virulence factor BrkB family protein, partial [Acetobacteraceae bacterium]